MKNDSSNLEQLFVRSLKDFKDEVKEDLLTYSKISTEEAAHKAVQEFNKLFDDKLRMLGINVSNPDEQYADLVHLRKWRKRIDEISMKVGSGIVMAILAGVIALLMAGYKNFK